MVVVNLALRDTAEQTFEMIETVPVMTSDG
jgi:hypothetical protein